VVDDQKLTVKILQSAPLGASPFLGPIEQIAIGQPQPLASPLARPSTFGRTGNS
jgi:hypothetical protein